MPYAASAMAFALACLAFVAAPAASGALTLPPGLPADHRDRRPERPDGRRDRARRPRVRRGEERRSSRPTTASRTRPRHVRRPAHAGAQLLQPRAAGARGRSRLPGQALRLRLLHARRADRRHAARRSGQPGQTSDQCPGDIDEVNCVVSARVSRLRVGRRAVGRPRAGARQRLVPAVPVPPGRRDRVRRGRLPVRVGRRRRALGDLGLRPARQPDEPVRRPARQPVGGPMSPADRRGRPPARAGPAHERRPARPERLADPHRSRHRRGRARQPDVRERRAERAPHARARLPQPGRGSRSVRAPTTSGWRTAAAATGRSSTASRDPTDPVRNFGWPCYEGGLDANGVPYAAHPARAATTRSWTSARTSMPR